MEKCICGHEMTKASWKNEWVCHRCGRTEPIYISVAEHIRSMGNDELAEYLVYNVKCTACAGVNCDEEFCLNLMREQLESAYRKA